MLQDREGNVWIGDERRIGSVSTEPVVSLPLQPISYRGALPIPSLNSFTTSAIAAGDQGELWAAGRGPEVLLELENDRIATQLRDQNVDCAYRDPDGAVWIATWRSIFRISSHRLDAINPKPGEVTYTLP